MSNTNTAFNWSLKQDKLIRNTSTNIDDFEKLLNSVDFKTIKAAGATAKNLLYRKNYLLYGRKYKKKANANNKAKANQVTSETEKFLCIFYKNTKIQYKPGSIKQVKIDMDGIHLQ